MKKSMSVKSLILKPVKPQKLILALKTPKTDKNIQNLHQRTLSSTRSCKCLGESSKKVRKIDLRFTGSKNQSIQSSQKRSNILKEIDDNQIIRNASMKKMSSVMSTNRKRQKLPENQLSCFEDFSKRVSSESQRCQNWQQIIESHKKTLNSYIYRIDKKIRELQQQFDIQPEKQNTRPPKKCINLGKGIISENRRNLRKNKDLPFCKQIYQLGKYRSKKSSINLL